MRSWRKIKENHTGLCCISFCYMRLPWYIVIVVTLVVLFTCPCHCKKKKNPLQPFYAREISGDVKEPSGASYCSSTGSLWLICDKPSCHYIYELDLNGELLNNWAFDKEGHDDLEAVACDDANQVIYIAEEGYMRITSFVLPRLNQTDSYITSKKGKLKLIELDHFLVDLDVRGRYTTMLMLLTYCRASEIHQKKEMTENYQDWKV